MFLVRILIGFGIVGVGFLMVYKTVSFQDFTGRIDWAEEKLGSGGTTTFIKLLGVGAMMIGFMVVTNLYSRVAQSFAGLFVR